MTQVSSSVLNGKQKSLPTAKKLILVEDLKIQNSKNCSGSNVLSLISVLKAWENCQKNTLLNVENYSY